VFSHEENPLIALFLPIIADGRDDNRVPHYAVDCVSGQLTNASQATCVAQETYNNHTV